MSIFVRTLRVEGGRDEPPDIDGLRASTTGDSVPLPQAWSRPGSTLRGGGGLSHQGQPARCRQGASRSIRLVHRQEHGVVGSRQSTDIGHPCENRLRRASPQNPASWSNSPTLQGFPRHLSQHPGGFVIARDRPRPSGPYRNAAMPDRTVIQWDKDDIDALGLMKVDVLGPGMLSCIRRALDMVGSSLRRPRQTSPSCCRTSGPKTRSSTTCCVAATSTRCSRLSHGRR